MVEPIKI
jgi:ATP-dependent RNA helicase DDX52/ROK1